MSQPAVLQLVIAGLSVLVAVGLLYLWRRLSGDDAAGPQVRVLGLYSPILTWLRNQRRPQEAMRPSVTGRPAVTFFAAQSSRPSSNATPTAVANPTGPGNPSLWDQLQRGWSDFPAAMRGWAKENVTPRSLLRAWSSVLVRPTDDTASVGV